MSVQVRFDGPFFDGRVQKEIELVLDDIAEDAADLGLQMLHQAFGQTLVAPTGRYERGLQADLIPDGVDLHDGGSIYGPWLEGTSSRNSSTRFKGYANFRRTAQELESRLDDLAEAALQKRMDRMN